MSDYPRDRRLVSWLMPMLCLLVLNAYSFPAWARCGESETTIAAAPSRPIESSAPDPINTGVAEVELGFTHVFSSSVAANGLPSLLKLGLWCNTEIRWSTSGLFSLPTGSTANSAISDNYFAAQYRFLRESKSTPSTAIGYSFKSPTASPSLGIGSGYADHSVTLMAGKTIHGFSTVMNATCFFIGQPNGSSTKGEWTMAVTHVLKGRYSFTGEVFGDSTLNSANQSYATSTWVLTYGWSPRLVFDAGANLAMTSGPGSPGHAAFAGVSYALGDIYGWRRR